MYGGAAPGILNRTPLLSWHEPPVPESTLKRPKPHASPLGAIPGAFVNLSHNLRYVEAGYLAAMDAELNGVPALPATRDVLAAFHPVVFHHLAKKAGIPVAPMRVVEDEEDLEAPCRLVPAHAYMNDYADAQTLVGAKRNWNSVSMGGGQPACMYLVRGKPFEVRSFLGMTTAAGKEDLVWQVWNLFHVPLVRILGYQADDDIAVTHLEPLRLVDLTERDLALFAEVSERPYSGVSWTA